jgi:hypothetical protein
MATALLLAQDAHGDDADFQHALRGLWRRISREYDEVFLLSRGYLWWTERDCWRAPHKPQQPELEALDRLAPYFRGHWLPGTDDMREML